MKRKQTVNLAASIQGQLLQLAKQKQEDYNYLLMRYASDRLLYRLSQSQYKQKFVLKGATLFRVWNGEPHRATKDLDLLSYGTNEVSNLMEIFQEICCVSCEDDGINFQPEDIIGEKIKEDQEYEGVRLKLKGKLGSIPLMVQVDIGFGDAIASSTEQVSFPAILDLPVPCLQIYPRETVVAEKFQAMVSLGISNSRLKDFYDIWFLCQHFEFQGSLLSQAIQATFERRKTPLPMAAPLALTAEFSEDADKQKQWQGFLKKGQLKSTQKSLSQTIGVIKDFVMPPCFAMAKSEDFNLIWFPSEGWQSQPKNKI
jgi:predicted nucleotidyltransferase component of viral defense system